MTSDTSSGQDDSGSTVALLGTSVGVGLVLGIVGIVAAAAITYATNVLWAPVGLVPAALAGFGVRKVAGERAGVLTGLVAVVVGHGPVLLLYYLLVAVFGAYSFGRADAAVVLFGFLVAYKLGTGSEGGSSEGGSTDERSGPAAGEVDPADVDSAAVAEALAGDDDADLDDLADALEAEGSTDEATPPAGAPAASDVAAVSEGDAAVAGEDDGTDDDDATGDGDSRADEGTASDWVNDD